MKKFKNVVSLGFNCHVAKDLERLGYRNASYPFDWLISDFKDVLSSIENGFSEWLELDNIEQDEEHKNVYHDRGTGFDFYHDFFPDKSIEQQYPSVKEKYCRRIERFQKDCLEPTLFIRFVRNEDELRFIKENNEKILSVLKNSNENNECIYLVLADKLTNTAEKNQFFICTELLHPIKTSADAKKCIKQNFDIKASTHFKNIKRYTTKRLKVLKNRF